MFYGGIGSPDTKGDCLCWTAKSKSILRPRTLVNAQIRIGLEKEGLLIDKMQYRYFDGKTYRFYPA